jgi:polynucleotide 5'-kinase involved in rRNA processing
MENGDAGYVKKAGDWLWENRAWVASRLQEIWGWLSGEKDEQPAGRLLIIGPGGVGKSTTGRFLSGQYNSLLSIPHSR